MQVGQLAPAPETSHAELWRGTADSFADIGPSGSTWSEVFGTDGVFHVGQAYFGGVSHAYLWLGKENGIDLHSYLPPQFWFSQARDVYSDGATIYVTGIASDGPLKAWLWVGTIPAPGTVSVLLASAVVLSNRRRRG